MIGLLAAIVILLVLALVVRATSHRHAPSRDPVVINMVALRTRAREPVPLAAAALPRGPRPSSPFDQDLVPQLPTGPPPPPGAVPRPAGTLPGPDPPRPVGALLEANTGPPTYGAAGIDAYCP